MLQIKPAKLKTFKIQEAQNNNFEGKKGQDTYEDTRRSPRKKDKKLKDVLDQYNPSNLTPYRITPPRRSYFTQRSPKVLFDIEETPKDQKPLGNPKPDLITRLETQRAGLPRLLPNDHEIVQEHLPAIYTCYESYLQLWKTSLYPNQRHLSPKSSSEIPEFNCVQDPIEITPGP